MNTLTLQDENFPPILTHSFFLIVTMYLNYVSRSKKQEKIGEEIKSSNTN